MFEQHFGLRRTPFVREIPVEVLYRSQAHKEALARLRYVAEHRMFMALTGESGVGKSTTLRALKHELDPARFEVIYLGLTNPSTVGFFEALLAALHVEIPYRPSRARRLASEVLLERFRNQRRTPVLLVDEVQGFSMPLLEAIRGLMNYDCDSFSPFALVLAGSEEFRLRLPMRGLQALAGRLQMRFHLTGLKPEETVRYVEHQLQAAGATGEIFTRPALQRLHEVSTGIPRHINHLATLALMAAAGVGTRLVDEELVRALIETEWQGGRHEKAIHLGAVAPAHPRVTITTRGISIRAGEQKLTLVRVDHVDEFMGRFAEAWARWEKADDDDDDS